MSDQATTDPTPTRDGSTPDAPFAEGVNAAPPELGYEEARDELMRIVQQLESGAAPLTDALALWERGEELAVICQRWLDGARARIEAARPGPSTRPDRAAP